MDYFYTFGFAALIAVAFKTLILFQVRATSRLNTAFVIACLALILQNALEFCGYITYALNPEAATLFLHGLIISLYLVCGAILYLCAAIVEHRNMQSIAYLCIGSVVILTASHLLGFSVIGFEHVGYSIISEPGSAYFLFQLFALSCAIASLTLLLRGSFSRDSSIASRSRLGLMAVLPLCLVGIGVVVARAMGFNSSSAIVMPIASTLFVWIVMFEARGDIVEVKLKWRFIWSILKYAKDTSIHEWPELTDRIQLIEAMRMCNNKKNLVAKLLRTSPPTITRKCAKYGIGDSTVSLSPLPSRSEVSQ